MKLEILRSDQGVEIHLHNEDGSITVWLCDSDQAAVFKLSSLIFSTAEDPKMAKRSILVGDFEPEAAKREKPLVERAEEVAKRLGVKVDRKAKESEAGMAKASEQFAELLEQLKKNQLTPAYDQPFIQPYTYPKPAWPMSYPYVGDPIGFPGGSVIVDVNAGKPYGAIGGCIGSAGLEGMDLESDIKFFSATPTGAQLTDTPVATFMNSNHCQVVVFKTSLKAAG